MGNNSSKDIEEASLCTSCEKECCLDSEFNSKLYGTVKPYNRAIIICTGNQLWPEKIESLENTFVGVLLKTIKHHEQNITGKIKITLCDEAKSKSDGYDIYVYPDQVKYIGMTENDIGKFVIHCLVMKEICKTINYISVTDKILVVVCVHGSRDKRCGRAGPLIINKVKDIIYKKGLINKINIVGSSHIGGHKYAGVAIVYPSGDHYGYVTDKRIEEIIDHHLENNIYRPLWRGKMTINS